MLTQFSPGQIWKYTNRPGEDESLITVAQVDVNDEELGPIIHISISNLEIPNPDSPEGKTSFLGHLPYSSDALAESVTEMVADEAQPNEYFEEGYELWKQAFDNNEAGVFEIPVSEAITFIEKSVA